MCDAWPKRRHRRKDSCGVLVQFQVACKVQQAILFDDNIWGSVMNQGRQSMVIVDGDLVISIC